MYDFLKVLNVTQLFHLEYAKFLYRFHSNLLPIPIGGYFLADPYVNRHRYGLRSRTTNQPTRLVRKTRFADNSIQVKGPKIWEEIPDDIKESPSLSIFKRDYKSLLLSQNTS